MGHLSGQPAAAPLRAHTAWPQQFPRAGRPHSALHQAGHLGGASLRGACWLPILLLSNQPGAGGAFPTPGFPVLTWLWGSSAGSAPSPQRRKPTAHRTHTFELRDPLNSPGGGRKGQGGETRALFPPEDDSPRCGACTSPGVQPPVHPTRTPRPRKLVTGLPRGGQEAVPLRDLDAGPLFCHFLPLCGMSRAFRDGLGHRSCSGLGMSSLRMWQGLRGPKSRPQLAPLLGPRSNPA